MNNNCPLGCINCLMDDTDEIDSDLDLGDEYGFENEPELENEDDLDF